MSPFWGDYRGELKIPQDALKELELPKGLSLEVLPVELSLKLPPVFSYQ
jgi:hypothetical protein